jgi:hypothetical protein
MISKINNVQMGGGYDFVDGRLSTSGVIEFPPDDQLSCFCMNFILFYRKRTSV